MTELTAIFQLHHTGIKTLPAVYCLSQLAEFQLHHTGIKTLSVFAWRQVERLFQLHHTGIKTIEDVLQSCDSTYFNCTIQELKQHGLQLGYFFLNGFQLHHTGIKTTGKEGLRASIV